MFASKIYFTPANSDLLEYIFVIYHLSKDLNHLKKHKHNQEKSVYFLQQFVFVGTYVFISATLLSPQASLLLHSHTFHPLLQPNYSIISPTLCQLQIGGGTQQINSFACE